MSYLVHFREAVENNQIELVKKYNIYSVYFKNYIKMIHNNIKSSEMIDALISINFKIDLSLLNTPVRLNYFNNLKDNKLALFKYPEYAYELIIAGADPNYKIENRSFLIGEDGYYEDTLFGRYNNNNLLPREFLDLLVSKKFDFNNIDSEGNSLLHMFPDYPEYIPYCNINHKNKDSIYAIENLDSIYHKATHNYTKTDLKINRQTILYHIVNNPEELSLYEKMEEYQIDITVFNQDILLEYEFNSYNIILLSYIKYLKLKRDTVKILTQDDVIKQLVLEYY